jgi:hypothetical protein
LTDVIFGLLLLVATVAGIATATVLTVIGVALLMEWMDSDE